MEDTDLHLLGAPVLHHGAAREPLRPERPYLLLAYLACRGDWVRRDELADLLYPGRELEAARSNLRKVLLLARRVPGVAAIEQRGDLLRWAPPSDLRRFDRACDEQRWADALAEHHGELLLGLDAALPGDHDWLDAERQRVQARWHEACARRLAQLADDPEAARRLAETMLRHDPLDDVALQALGRAQQALGRAGDALAALAGYTERLQAAGVAPSAAVAQLGRDLQSGQAPPPPVPGGLVGRRQERARVRERLAEPGCRLLTLLGPPGVGKSALARAVAAELQGTWIALEELAAADQVPGVVAQRLGLHPDARQPPWDALAAALAGRQVLLVLDNAEHLPLAPGLERLLAAAPGVQVLAASRAPLGVAGEWRDRVDGLPLPDADETDAEVLRANDAVRLFEQRARPLAPDFDLGAEAADVVRLVHEVDGLPLAIELLAAWRRLMPVREIVAELAASLDVLEGSAPTERSVRASFARSWQQLAAPEQRLLAQLALLPGPVGREMVRQVLQAPLPALAVLVDRSLLRAEGDGRFALHPLVRRCAAPFAAEADELLARHARHVAAVHARDAARLAQEIAHVLAAWRWALAQRDVGVAGALVEPLARHLLARVQLRELDAAMAEAVEVFAREVPADGPLPPGRARDATRLVAAAQVERASALYSLGDLDESLRLAGAGRALAQRLADRPLMGKSHAREGAVHWQRGDYSAARREFSALHDCADTDFDRARALAWLALVDKAQGDYAQAASRYEQALVRMRAAGELPRHVYLLNNRGNLLRLLGRHAEALATLHEGLAIARAERQHHDEPFLVTNVALAHESSGETAAALDWAERAVQSAREHGEPMIEAAARLARARLRARLGGAGPEPMVDVWDALGIAARVKSLPIQIQCLATAGVVLAAGGRRADGLALVRWAQAQPAFTRSEREDADAHLARLGFAAGEPPPAGAVLADDTPLDAVMQRLRPPPP